MNENIVLRTYTWHICTGLLFRPQEEVEDSQNWDGKFIAILKGRKKPQKGLRRWLFSCGWYINAVTSNDTINDEWCFVNDSEVIVAYTKYSHMACQVK
jgi:hypothetical protein